MRRKRSIKSRKTGLFQGRNNLLFTLSYNTSRTQTQHTAVQTAVRRVVSVLLLSYVFNTATGGNLTIRIILVTMYSTGIYLYQEDSPLRRHTYGHGGPSPACHILQETKKKKPRPNGRKARLCCFCTAHRSCSTTHRQHTAWRPCNLCCCYYTAAVVAAAAVAAAAAALDRRYYTRKKARNRASQKSCKRFRCSYDTFA